LFLLPLLLSIFTGFALYAEGAGIESAWYTAFGWVFALLGDSFTVHTIHRISMWVIICFTVVHIYVAIREDIMSRQSLVSTMISGWRYFKDDKE
jgi:Ni/Fe-hydrogenase 1 B-type cytochrome subunit